MAKNLLFDCHYSEIWVHPENWKSLTTQKSLKLNWYVECKFYDPLFKEKYPKGFPYRKKLNSYRTIEERKAAVQLLLKEIPKLLEDKGYNPITKKYMIPEPKPVLGVLHPKLNFTEALKITYPLLSVSEGVKKEIKRIVNKVEKSAAELRIEFSICEIHSGHIRDLLDPLDLTPNEYNKYLTHLSIVLSDLVEKRMVFHNPIRDIKKKKTTKKIRETLELDEMKLIFEYLKSNYYEFYRYGMIFFHSGSRSAELFRLQKKDVKLDKQEYKLTVRKGNHYKEVKKIILINVISFWQQLINNCSSENDFLFSKGLEPGENEIQPYQITKRWKRLVKDRVVFKDGRLVDKRTLDKNDTEYEAITADFYALKHLFLDELDKASDSALSLSKEMACHTTNVTETVYLVGRENRKNEVLKKIQLQALNF
jgi:site-specific recombinase XerC